MAYHKVIKSGLHVESYEYQKSLASFQRDGRKGSYDSGYRKGFTRRADNVRRAVSAFRRLVRSNCVGDQNITLLTLTILQVLPLETCWGLFSQFFASFRHRFGKKIRYIAVPEFQDRGAVHFHVLIWDLPDQYILHEGSTGTYRNKEQTRKRFVKWLAKKGYSVSEMRNDRTIQGLWRFGYVDCVPTDGSPALAFYLSDYLSSAMRDVRLGGARAYSYSRNVLRPMFTAAPSFEDDECYRLGISGEPKYESESDTQWLGKCRYKAFDLGVDNEVDENMYDNVCWF